MNRIIEHWILNFIADYSNQKDVKTKWRKPLIGFSEAKDPLFSELKKIIGPNHALPEDLVPDARSVVAFFLPFSEEIVKSNAGGIQSSKEWDYACIETNSLIGDLTKYLHDQIAHEGFEASLLPPTYNYDSKKLKSDWSHRSVAYIAGLGTFGIHNMLITESGCCGRFGSVVTNMKLTPSDRKEGENCLYKFNGSCGVCIDRCVCDALAIQDSGAVSYNRYLCNKQIYDREIPQYDIGLGDACGKCMVGLPCSIRNPIQSLSSK